MSELSTLCYIEKDGKYLMLHRTVKKHDVNKDKWIGVGGHFEQDESPEECVLREVWEETGFTLTSWRFRGLVTFVSGNGVTEYMHLFTADDFTGTPIECNEGVLEWVDIEQVWKLNIWAGDKIFFRLLDENLPFFSLKLVYNGSDRLVSASLNGKEMELLDILKEDGTPSGITQERGVIHREGALHGVVHTWIVRPVNSHPSCEDDYEVLLQVRSHTKDSNPGAYDISSAGHISAGDTPLSAAIREIGEELGVTASPKDLMYLGCHRGSYKGEFYGRIFRDEELSSVFLYKGPVCPDDFILQESEVERVLWMNFAECRKMVTEHTSPHCIYAGEFDLVAEYLFCNDIS